MGIRLAGRSTVWLSTVLVLIALAPPSSHSEQWPSKPVRIIAPYPAGGPGDVPARAFGQVLSEMLGQPFLIENRLGADGIIGAEACAKAPADGHTLCFVSNGVTVVNPAIRLKLPYDSRDLVPVVHTGTLHTVVLVHRSVPANSMQEVIATLKAKPQSLTYGTYGQVTLSFFLAEWLKARMGASFYQVPYKSATQALQALVAGEVQAASYALGAARALVQAGKLKALAINSDQRLASLPDVPTLKELGIEVPYRSWFGIYAPRGTANEIVRRLNTEIARMLADAQFKAKSITPLGFETDWPTGASPEEFAKFLQSDREQFLKLLNAIGLKPQ